VKVTGRSPQTIVLKGPIGPSLAIALSEPGDQQVRWVVKVTARTHEGDFRIGEFRTEPPKDVQAHGGAINQANDPLFRATARLVAVANWPGAIGWSITVFPIALTSVPASEAVGSFFLSSLPQPVAGEPTGGGAGAKCCSDLSPPAPGVYPVHSDGAIGPYVYDWTSAPVTNIGTAPVLISGANPYRRRLVLRAQNTNPVVIGETNAVSLATGFHVSSLDYLEITHQRAVWAAAVDTTRGALDVMEDDG